MTETAFELKDNMVSVLANARYGPEYSPQMAQVVAFATAAISRLDARILVSSVASAWQKRAAWLGYTRALQLQSVEIDEIDVFSWGCELRIAGRALRCERTKNTASDTPRQFT